MEKRRKIKCTVHLNRVLFQCKKNNPQKIKIKIKYKVLPLHILVMFCTIT
jgi:hypothetical protein